MLAQLGASVHNHGGTLDRLVNIHGYQMSVVSYSPLAQIRTAKICLNDSVTNEGKGIEAPCVYRKR
jgi:hypothetical protein